MIDATASLQAAQHISATALVKYLHEAGWSSRSSRVQGVDIFSKQTLGVADPVQFILPIDPRYPDQERRIADALRTIAQIEGRSLTEVTERIQQAIGDSKDSSKNTVWLVGKNETDYKTSEDIKIAAQRLRELLGLSSDRKAFDIVELLEKQMPKAVDHFRLEILARNDVQEVYSTNTPPRIFTTEAIYHLARKGDANSRFLLAHEIGHCLLHSPRDDRGQLKSFGWSKKTEAEASKFAIFFLITDAVARQFSNADTLSHHCQVRREVAELRMNYLRVNDMEGPTSLDRKTEEIHPQALKDIAQGQSRTS